MSLRSPRLSRSALLIFLAIGAYCFFGPGWPFSEEERHFPLVFSDEELRSLAQDLRVTDVPSFDSRERRVAALGRQLFHDARFSSSGEIACTSCHQPGRDFSDGRPLAIGLGPLQRHTPSLVNSYALTWFFWDGRADSLSAQVQGPVEASDEHGFDRGRVAQMLFRHYKAPYEDLFGPFPAVLSAELARAEPFKARPRPSPLELPLSVAHYALATIRDDSLQISWIQAGANAKLAPQRHLAQAYWPTLPESEETRAFAALSSEQRQALNQIFARFSWALAQYERGLVARQSPFDRFAARLEALPEEEAPASAFEDKFKDAEWRGFRLFMESGCASCHSGPHFSDQEFHNIGLAQRGPKLDLGRAAGVLQVKADQLNCIGLSGFLDPLAFKDNKSDSCASLPFLRLETQELVGAFKTPMLRNVGQTAPYMHDGRFASLKEVLKFYNELDEEAAVGHREETLKPLRLGEAQLLDLEAFLQSLSSPIEDLSASQPEQKARLEMTPKPGLVLRGR